MGGGIPDFLQLATACRKLYPAIIVLAVMVSMKRWMTILEPRGVADMTLRAAVIFALSAWLFLYGMVFQEPYNTTLIELHLYPWWNILLVLMVAAGAIWCPRVGVLAALAVLLYLSDMDLLMRPLDPELDDAIKTHLVASAM